jgi:hypothetical protein
MPCGDRGKIMARMTVQTVLKGRRRRPQPIGRNHDRRATEDFYIRQKPLKHRWLLALVAVLVLNAFLSLPDSLQVFLAEQAIPVVVGPFGAAYKRIRTQAANDERASPFCTTTRSA